MTSEFSVQICSLAAHSMPEVVFSEIINAAETEFVGDESKRKSWPVKELILVSSALQFAHLCDSCLEETTSTPVPSLCQSRKPKTFKDDPQCSFSRLKFDSYRQLVIKCMRIRSCFGIDLKLF